MTNAEKLEGEKNLDIIDVFVVFIIAFRIVDDVVVKNKKSYHWWIIIVFVLLFESMMFKTLLLSFVIKFFIHGKHHVLLLSCHINRMNCSIAVDKCVILSRLSGVLHKLLARPVP